MKQVCIALAICLIFISAVSATKEHEAALAFSASARQLIKNVGFKSTGRGLAPAGATFWSMEMFSDSACKKHLANHMTGQYYILGCFSNDGKSAKIFEDPGKGFNMSLYPSTADCSGDATINQPIPLPYYYHGDFQKGCTLVADSNPKLYIKSSKNTMPHEEPGNVVVRSYLGEDCEENLLFHGNVYDATGECDRYSGKYTYTDTEVTEEDFPKPKCKGTPTKKVLATKKCTYVDAHEGHNFFVVPQAVSGAGRLDYLTTLLVSLTFVFGVMMF